MQETFGFANTVEVLRAVKVYIGSHYGSNLWQLDSPMAGQYFSAWRTCVKLAWQVPRASHSYFVDYLLASDLTSVRIDILSRYIKFMAGLHSSPSMEVSVMSRVAAGDVRTTTGLNLRLIKLETGIDPLSSSAPRVKAALVVNRAPIPDSDRWRLRYLAKLLEARGEAHFLGKDTDNLTVLVDSLCTT